MQFFIVTSGWIEPTGRSSMFRPLLLVKALHRVGKCGRRRLTASLTSHEYAASAPELMQLPVYGSSELGSRVRQSLEALMGKDSTAHQRALTDLRDNLTDTVVEMSPQELGLVVERAMQYGQWGVVMGVTATSAEVQLPDPQGAVSICCKQRKYDVAAALSLKSVKQGDRPLEAKVYAGVMAGLREFGRWRAVNELVSEPRLTYVLDEKGHSIAILACVEAGEWTQAVELLERAKMRGFANVACYHTAIEVCVRRSEWQKARELLTHALHAGVTPRRTSYHITLSAVARAGQPEVAVEILQEMKRVGIRVSEFCYGMVIKACVPGLHWEICSAMLREMDELKMVPHEFHAYALLVCCRTGHWQEALDMLDDMHSKSVDLPQQLCFEVLGEFVKAGRYVECGEAVERMRQRGLLTLLDACRVSLEAFRVSGQHVRAVELLKLMHWRGMEPSMETFESVLEGCVKDTRWEEARYLFDALKSQGSVPTRRCYDAMLALCGATGRGEEAVALLDEMEASGHEALLSDYKKVLAACRGASGAVGPAAVVERMERRGLKLDAECYAIHVSALAEKGELVKARQVLHAMQDNGVAPDTRCYLAVLEVFWSAQGWREASHVLEEMKMCPDITVDAEAYDKVIAVCGEADESMEVLRLMDEMTDGGIIAHRRSWMVYLLALGKLEMWERSVAELRRGMREGVIRDDFLMSAASVVFRTCCHVLRLKEAVDVASIAVPANQSRGKEAQADPGELDTQSLRVAVSGLAANDRVLDALDFLCLLYRRTRISPDDVALQILLKHLASGEHWRESIALLDGGALSRLGVTPSVLHYNAVMSGLAETRSLEARHEGLALWRRMKAAGLSPDLDTFNTAALLLRKTGRMEQLLQLLAWLRAPESEVTADAVTYSIAISAWGDMGRWQDARRLFEEMDASGVAPDDECFAALLRACASCGQLSEVRDVLCTMRERGIVRNNHHYRSLLKACKVARVPHEIVDVLKHMPADGVQPDYLTYSIALDTLIGEGRLDLVDWVVFEMERNGVAVGSHAVAKLLKVSGKLLEKMKSCNRRPS